MIQEEKKSTCLLKTGIGGTGFGLAARTR